LKGRERRPLRVVSARVERLITPPPAVSAARRSLEIALVAFLLVGGTVAAQALPSWIARDLDTSTLNIVYVPPTRAPVESPAFTTFRALTPDQDLPEPSVDEPVRVALLQGAWPRPPTPAPWCTCLEPGAQSSFRAATQEQRMAWRSSTAVRDSAQRVGAHPLLTFDDASSRVGSFLLARGELREAP
ncbi:MAG: hypothetical protein ACRDU8_00350, partial [Egibacteraceae bacterium]